MDKIRENLFGILVGALSLGLVAFAYFFVFAGLSALGEDGVQGDIKTELQSMKAYERRDHIPSSELHDRLQEQQKAISTALETGKEFYASIKRDFDRLFPGMPSDPRDLVPADFKPLYTDAVDALKEAYIEAYPQAAPPTGEEETFRAGQKKKDAGFAGLEIQIMPVTTIPEVQRAMKEYWVSKRVCDVLHGLDIGGLQEIKFPGRGVVDENAPSHFKAIKAEITLDMPFHKLLPLLAAIYSRPQVDEANPDDVPAVPFYELEDFTMTRKQDTVVVPIVVVKKPGESTEPVNGNASPGGEHSLRDPAPNVFVTMKLSALDWRGLEEAAEEDDEDD